MDLSVHTDLQLGEIPARPDSFTQHKQGLTRSRLDLDWQSQLNAIYWSSVEYGRRKMSRGEGPPLGLAFRGREESRRACLDVDMDGVVQGLRLSADKQEMAVQTKTLLCISHFLLRCPRPDSSTTARFKLSAALSATPPFSIFHQNRPFRFKPIFSKLLGHHGHEILHKNCGLYACIRKLVELPPIALAPAHLAGQSLDPLGMSTSAKPLFCIILICRIAGRRINLRAFATRAVAVHKPNYLSR
ncbi:Uncharacterized protein HZ326_22456 [Fusarium oxysporum f. sp. albedinis]|nr:Uncharacterized protein HZ326_22456 [Fusarium oxysporum f. sp. albedinis]